MFKGSNVALITPFKDNELDIDAYIKLIHYHLENGTNGLVPAGTTGESPTLNHEEHQKVIEICVREAKGKIPVASLTPTIFLSSNNLAIVSTFMSITDLDGIL